MLIRKAGTGGLAFALLLLSGVALGQGVRAGRQAGPRNAQAQVAQVPVELLETLCKLTPEQVTKIRAIQTKLQEDLRALRPRRGDAPESAAAQKRRDLTQQAATEINNVLTPEQKEALRGAAAELSALRSLNIPLQVVPELKLTAEQKQKIAQIAKEIREKVRALPVEERRAKSRELLTEARSRIEALLTDEQKGVIQKAREQARRRGAGRRNSAPPA
jgi:Spy/CpxP family protein refolding chaperone